MQADQQVADVRESLALAAFWAAIALRRPSATGLFPDTPEGSSYSPWPPPYRGSRAGNDGAGPLADLSFLVPPAVT